MNWRGKSGKSKWVWRAVLLATIPVGLAGLAWKVRAETRPVEVKLGPQLIKSRVLFERINAEARHHPYASKINVSWSAPWLPQSGLDITMSQSLELDRSKHTLFYSTEQYGWVYNHVEDSGLDVLAKTHLDQDPITLPASVQAQLCARGWTLTEHYLP